MPDPISSSVSSLLTYYHDEVVPALATAVTVSHTFPQEVLNELRNAMTHMGRANALNPQTNIDDVNHELKAAKRHLLRCTLDCLKIVLLTTAKRCESTIDALDNEMLLPVSVHNESRDLRGRRIELSKHEGQNPIDDVVEKLKVLCDDYDRFSRKLEVEFSGDVIANRRSIIRKRVWKERAWGFLFGFLASAIVTLAAWWFLPTISTPDNPAPSPPPPAASGKPSLPG